LFLGFLALIILAIVVLYPAIKKEIEEQQASGQAVTITGGAGIGAVIGGDRSHFTADFEPESRPALTLGDGTRISEAQWPERLGEFAFDGEAENENPLFANSIGGASYVNADESRVAYALVVPYVTSSDFINLVNSSMGIEFPEGGGTVEILGGFPVFYKESELYARFTMISLRSHAVYLTLVGTDQTHPDSDELIDVAELLIRALTASRDGAASSDAVADSVNLVDADFGYDENNERDQGLSAGPAIDADGEVAWPEPEPAEEFFALARAGIPLPDAFSGLDAEAAGYSAINFEANVSRGITAVFFPLPESSGGDETPVAEAPGEPVELFGERFREMVISRVESNLRALAGEIESLDDLFKAVLKSLADPNGKIGYEGYDGFYILSDGEPVAEVAVQTVASPLGTASIAAFDNGILVCLPDTTSPEEPADAFPSLRELGLNFVRVFAVHASNASKQ